MLPQGHGRVSLLPRAAFSHSASVGNRLPAHCASASRNAVCVLGVRHLVFVNVERVQVDGAQGQLVVAVASEPAVVAAVAAHLKGAG